MLRRLLIATALALAPSLALAQGTVLQGGPWTPGHAPMYVGQGSSQPVVQDSGSAGGGGPGVGLSELGITARGTGAAPFSGQGTGPFGTNLCDYDAPQTNATGGHFLCISPNATGGVGIVAFGAFGAATQIPLVFNVNGISYPFPFVTGGIVGPATTVSGDLACWNNTIGTLLRDCARITLAQLPLITNNTLLGNTSGIPAAPIALTTLPTGLTIPNPTITGPLGLLTPPASVTLNVDHVNGVDQQGCGFSVSGAGACKTILYAFTQFQTFTKVGPTGIAVIQSDCNFTETPSVAFLGPSATGGIGGGAVFILGNIGSPSSCFWTSGGWSVDDGAVISAQGFQTANANTNQDWVIVDKGGILVFQNMIWGAATGASGNHVHVRNGGALVYDGGSYQVGAVSCAPNCFHSHILNEGGSVRIEGASVSIPSALSWGGYYVGLNSGSNASFAGSTFTGAGSGAGSTGLQYQVTGNATLGVGVATLPGASTGSAATGACVNNVCAYDASQITSNTLPPARLGGLGVLTNALSGDVTLNNTGAFFDGPAIAQGATGTWCALGQATALDTAGSAIFFVKLWDGATIIASGSVTSPNASGLGTVTLSGCLATPAGNLRISVKDVTATTGKISAAGAGTNSSTITAFRIN